MRKLREVLYLHAHRKRRVLHGEDITDEGGCVVSTAHLRPHKVEQRTSTKAPADRYGLGQVNWPVVLVATRAAAAAAAMIAERAKAKGGAS
jgi:hypothetical protein